VSIFDSAKFSISVAHLSGLPPENLPEIAFAGRSNAGKSTSINVITRQTRLAFASKTPGRTQLINFFALSQKRELGQREKVGYLVDLPGYGFAKASEDTRKTWSQLVGGYIAQRQSLCGLVIVMDARRPFMPTDEWLIDFMAERPNVKMLWLLNKADQLKNMQRREVLKLAQERATHIGSHVSVQLFSGLKKEGVESLQATLLDWLNLNTN
jgi:GTP-binding protein